MRRIKDIEFLLFSLWLIFYGIWHLFIEIDIFVLRRAHHMFISHIVFGIIGYSIISIVVLMRLRKVRGVEKAATVFLALLLFATGVMDFLLLNIGELFSYWKTMSYLVRFAKIHSNLALFAGVFLLIEFQRRKPIENIGRFFFSDMAGWGLLRTINWSFNFCIYRNSSVYSCYGVWGSFTDLSVTASQFRDSQPP